MTYDDLQRAAPKLTCAICGRDYFVASKQAPEPAGYVCPRCPEAGTTAARETPR